MIAQIGCCECMQIELLEAVSGQVRSVQVRAVICTAPTLKELCWVYQFGVMGEIYNNRNKKEKGKRKEEKEKRKGRKRKAAQLEIFAPFHLTLERW